MSEKLEHWLAKLPQDFQRKSGCQTAFLIGLKTDDDDETTLEMDELELLLGGLEIPVIGRYLWRRNDPYGKSLIGPGQLEKLVELLSQTSANLIVSNESLKPSQMAAIREATCMEVWDRGMVITQIFELRSSSAESQSQLALAKLRGQMPSLRGLGNIMSRSGAGIGTRGSGETELTRHQRKISRQELFLNRRLKQRQCHREITRKNRKKSALPIFALVGYTNSGKTTLLGRLVKDSTLTGEDKLFATLDTKTRRLVWDDHQVALVVDTVGFIRKLPPYLESSFCSTLEELDQADFLLLVLDGHDPNCERTADVVIQTLSGLGLEERETILIVNKVEDLGSVERGAIEQKLKGYSDQIFFVSGLTGEGVEPLRQWMKDCLNGGIKWPKA